MILLPILRPVLKDVSQYHHLFNKNHNFHLIRIHFTNVLILTDKFHEMISLVEGVSNKHNEINKLNYQKFTKTNMTRIYPSGSRINSSNYSPLEHWDSGAQMVALNYQYLDPSAPLLLNKALFSKNRQCGYVLKPEYLRNPEAKLNKTELVITVLSGQFLNHFDTKNEDINLKVVVRVHSPHFIVYKSTLPINNGICLLFS